MFGIHYRDLLMMSLLFDTSCSGSRTIPIQTVSVNGTANIHWSMQATNIHFIEIKHNNNKVNSVSVHGRPDNLIVADYRLSAIIRESKITLTITNVRYEDAGIYTCSINIAHESKDVQLIVSALEKGNTVDIPGTVPPTSIGRDNKTDLQWPGDEGSHRFQLIVMVVIGLMVLFFIRGERVDSIGMAAHSYESINSLIHGRAVNSVTHNADDTSTVAMGQELSRNTNTGILASNLSLSDDGDAIPISHDGDGVTEMNDISTMMTRPDHLTSALEILLTGNTRIAAGTISSTHASNGHFEECATFRNNYDRLQMRSQDVDNSSYTSLKDQTTEL